MSDCILNENIILLLLISCVLFDVAEWICGRILLPFRSSFRSAESVATVLGSGVKIGSIRGSGFLYVCSYTGFGGNV